VEQDIKKIVSLLQKFQPYTSAEELEKVAQDLLVLGLFLVRMRVKEYSQSSKLEGKDAIKDIKVEPP